MKREQRYLIAKLDDIDKYLTAEEGCMLLVLITKLREQRIANGKGPLKCVVVEADWPGYEKVWDMIEERVDREGENNEGV